MENIIEDVIMILGAFLAGFGIDTRLWSFGLFGTITVITIACRKLIKLCKAGDQTKELKLRRRYSKYDKYIQEITQYRLSGMSVAEIETALLAKMPDANASAINAFCRSRKIPSLITQGARGDRNEMIPCCSGCSECYEVIGLKEGQKDRICRKSNRRILKACTTSPMWCEKRDGGCL